MNGERSEPTKNPLWEDAAVLSIREGVIVLQMRDHRLEYLVPQQCCKDGTSFHALRVGDLVWRRTRDGAVSAPVRSGASSEALVKRLPSFKSGDEFQLDITELKSKTPIHAVHACPCGKEAVGTHAELKTAGWRWSSAFNLYTCRECSRGLLSIAKERS